MNDKCMPLELVKYISNKYPVCWNQVELFRNVKTSGDLTWDDRCYIPISATLAIVTDGADLANIDYLNLKNSGINDAAIIAALAPWRIYKQIFSFDPDMEEMLYEQADDLVIPIEILNNMPYQCIYIETKIFTDVDGFFVHFESDTKNDRIELRFLILDNNKNALPIAIHMKDGNTIKDGIDQMYKENERIAKIDSDISEHIAKKSEREHKAGMYQIVMQLMQLVLYICAENKEIEEDQEQSKITKIPKTQEFIKDKFREIRKWNCGAETGNIIRGIYKKSNYVNYQISENPGSGSPKRPHARRAHWHHYWMGAKTDSERKLELKWIAPTFIHRDDIEDNGIIKINQIKNENIEE